LREALSIDSIEKYKPAKEPIYGPLQASRTTSTNAHDRAHGWDIAGAAHAGLATGFITREGQAIYPFHCT
jgi:2-haloacid dehalogenase